VESSPARSLIGPLDAGISAHYPGFAAFAPLPGSGRAARAEITATAGSNVSHEIVPVMSQRPLDRPLGGTDND